MRAWDELTDFLLDEAERDLEAVGEVRPCFVAFRGDESLFLAWSRPFEKGAHHLPMIELISLACPLGADRLALSLSGRAWSANDPIPPVVSGAGDLRQRVVAIEAVDGTEDPPARSSLIAPFELNDGTVRWAADRLSPDGTEGWTSSLLLEAVRRGGEIAGTDADIRQQALRCVALGHLVAFDPAVVERLDLGALVTRAG